MTHYCTLATVTLIKKTNHARCWKDVEKVEPETAAGENINHTATKATSLAVSQKAEHKFTVGPHTATPRYHTKRSNISTQRHIWKAVCRVLPQSPKLETNQTTLSWWVDKTWNTQYWILLSSKNKLLLHATTQKDLNSIILRRRR